MSPGQGHLSPAEETTSSIPQVCVSQVLFSWQPPFSKGGQTSVRTSSRRGHGWHGQPPSAHHSADMPSYWHFHALNRETQTLREAVTAPSLSEFSNSMDNALGTWSDSWCVLCRDRNWNPWSLWVPFNLAYSKILQNCECNSGINFISYPTGTGT